MCVCVCVCMWTKRVESGRFVFCLFIFIIIIIIIVIVSQIVSCVVDPLINAISESASGLGTVESAIYLLNCFHQLHSTLSLLHTTADKLEMIQVY